MKRLSLALLCLMLAVCAAAQDTPPADDYRALHATLSSRYVKNPDDIANLLDLARLHSRPDSPLLDLPQAAAYLSRAEDLYAAWLMDRGRYRDLQRLIKQGITLSLIRQQHQSLDEQALLHARTHAADMEQAERAAFLAAFGHNNQIATLLHAQQLRDDYRAARQENTIKALYLFRIAHPADPLADSADAAIAPLAATLLSALASPAAVDSVAALFPASPALQHAAMRQKSRMAYALACQDNTQAAYARYLDQYPRGDHYLQALARLQALRAMDYALLATPSDYADYAETHSDDPLADSALAQLRRMVTHDHNSQAAAIYLARFPLDVHYNEIYKHYYSWYADEGNRQPIQAFADAHPDYPFLMAVRSDLARSALIDSFDLTRPFLEADMPAMTDCIRLLMGRKAAFVALQRSLQGLIARREWSAALLRLQQFAICFEELNTDEYNELAALLTDKGRTARSPLFAHGSLRHLIAHPAADKLYFTLPSARNTIGLARRAAKGRNGWRYASAVSIPGAAADVTAFGFFDGGRSVLLGMGGDIWTARVVNDTLWTSLQRLPQPVNTPFVETDAFMLPDGSGILLASDRPGGLNVQQSRAYYHGDTALATDLYFIPFDNGSWGQPVNLGLPVNSPYCERSPLLSSNRRTLYFVTDARGLGYGDVYMTTRTDINDWCHWSRPVNLGRSLNGSFDEASVAFDPAERHLLVTSASPGGTAYAAFSAPAVHDTASSLRTVSLDLAEVLDLARSLDLVDLGQRKTVGHWSGTLLDTLQPLPLYTGVAYAALLSADWVWVPTLVVNPSSRATLSLQPFTLDTLRALGRDFPLPLVAFIPGTTRLQPQALLELDNLAHFMRQHPGSAVKLSVHVGGPDDRQSYDLSLARAQSLRSLLAAHGVDASRIAIAAYGNLRVKQGLAAEGVQVRFM